MGEYDFDFQEALRRVIKYLVEGAAVAFAAYYFPKKKMNLIVMNLICIFIE